MILSHCKVITIEFTLFLWHMPDDVVEGVAEHSCRLQPSIDLRDPVTTLCSAALILMYQSTTLEG